MSIFLNIILLIVNFNVTAIANILLKIAIISKSKKSRILFFLIGMGTIVLMSFMTVYSYSQLNITVVQSFLGLTYIATPILARLILKEELSKRIWFSLTAIIIGIIFLGYGNSI